MTSKAKRKTLAKKSAAPAKSVRPKSAAKSPRARSAPAKTEKDEHIETLMASSAQALGLSIDPAWRDTVEFHLRLVLEHAARVDEFPLPDEAEPAPVFHA